jgi:signal transduction histidine kinase
LSLARDLDDIMAIVRSGVRRVTGADGVTFVLRDGDACYYADEDAISPLWKGQRFPAERCISGWAMIHRQPVAITDIYQDSRIPHDAYRLTFVRSLAMVPVRQEDPVAAIGAYWACVRRIETSELDLLQTVANAAAVAMTNVALYHALEARAAEAERQAQALAAAMAELERAQERKSRFLAACSHDLRQPFQAMRLYHSVVEAKAAEDQLPAIDGLGKAMTQGEELLHALLDVSAIESGLSPVARTGFPVAEMFDRLAVAHAGDAAQKGLALRFVPCRARIDSDPVLLNRILGNLVANAIKYTTAGRVVVGARRHGRELSIEVWDTGIGIAAEHLEEVFDDFYQVGNPHRDKRCGIGLGLAIVRRLADKLDHRITVRSIEGKGSMFAVTVPLAGSTVS